MERIILFLLVVVFLPGQPVGLSAAPAKNIVYSIARSGPATLDPGLAEDDSSPLYTFNIYEPLVRANPKTSQLEPALAVSWESRQGGNYWVFKLRKKVKFHDGTDFNADAVVFSFDRQIDTKFKFRYGDFVMFREIFPYLKNVKKIDDYTVAFDLEKPFYPFLEALTAECAFIVSPTAVKKFGKDFTNNPVGTGPFTLKKWARGERVTLAAYPRYWRGKPGLDEFVVMLNKDDRVLQSLFRRRKVDILFSFSISRATGLKRQKSVSVYHSPKLSIDYISFNLKNKYLKKKNVRKAIQCLWDKRILRLIFQDYVIAANSLLPPGMPGHNPDLKTAFSIEKALEFLAKEKITGRIPLTFLMLEGPEITARMLSLFTQRLKQGGFDIKVDTVPAKDYYKRVAAGDYDLANGAWLADYPSPHSFIFPMFSGNLQATGFPNLSQHDDNELKKMVAASSLEGNSEKRTALYKKICRIIHDDALLIPLYHDTADFFYNSDRLEGVTLDVFGTMSLYDLKIKKQK
ncbi:MAG: ABC transporter substrate-binding protein [bacterium]|nr:ABC transporter substrate-binding protein [bacterium]